ncbi:MAG: PPOX class probable FMN-dependent enzyme [Candidatus Azotimanducaceae bacterium]|jgi:PPOX class probable FMN-dependent enzyme
MILILISEFSVMLSSCTEGLRDMTQPTNISLITTTEQLQTINGTVSPATALKVLPALEAHAKRFIERSPFLVMSSGNLGNLDASPRGDAPGFVKVLDDTTLLIPERPGNRIADTLTNIVDDSGVGLLMLIPGMNETLRVNGNAYITDHGPYLDQLAHNGKSPKLAIVVNITQVYFHCAKAFIRSGLWNPETFMERSEMPTLGKIIIEQIKGQPSTEEEAAMVDTSLEEDIKDNLYHT